MAWIFDGSYSLAAVAVLCCNNIMTEWHATGQLSYEMTAVRCDRDPGVTEEPAEWAEDAEDAEAADAA